MAAHEPETLLVGHSHICSFNVPLCPPAGAGATAIVEASAAGKGFWGLTGSFPRDDAYWDAAVNAARHRNVVILFQGNQHNSYFLFESGPRFDYVCRRLPDAAIDPEAQLIPEAMFRQFCRLWLPPLEALLPKMRQQKVRRIIVSETPPPKGDDRQLRAFLSVEPTIRQSIADMECTAETVPLTPPLIRLKLWHTLQEEVEALAVRSGVEFVRLPAAIFDETGYLKHEYWAHDATHMNFDGGALVARYWSELLR